MRSKRQIKLRIVVTLLAFITPIALKAFAIAGPQMESFDWRWLFLPLLLGIPGYFLIETLADIDAAHSDQENK